MITASDLKVAKTYEGGSWEMPGKRHISEIKDGYVWYFPVADDGKRRYCVRQSIEGFLCWCNEIATQEIANG